MMYKPVEDEKREILMLYMGAVSLLWAAVLIEEAHRQDSEISILRKMQQIARRME